PDPVKSGRGVLDLSARKGMELECVGLKMWMNDDDDDGVFHGTAMANGVRDFDEMPVDPPTWVQRDFGSLELGIIAGDYRFDIEDTPAGAPAEPIRLFWKDGQGAYHQVTYGTDHPASSLYSGTPSSIVLYFDAGYPSAAMRDFRLRVQAKFNGSPPCLPALPTVVQDVTITVFAVASIEIESGDQGEGTVAEWTSLSTDLVPSGLRPRLANEHDLFVETGARLGTDAPDGGGQPTVTDTYYETKRDRLKVVVHVVPPYDQFPVHVVSFDVDDNHIDMTGWADDNYVDDDDDFTQEVDNHGIYVDENGGVQTHPDGLIHERANSPYANPSNTLWGLTDAAGRFETGFVASTSPGDNYRVVAMIAPTADRLYFMTPTGKHPVANSDANVAWRVEQHSSGAWLGYLSVPVSDGNTKATALASSLITVRRKVYMTEHRHGTDYSDLANLPPTLIDRDLERSTARVLRYITGIRGGNLLAVAGIGNGAGMIPPRPPFQALLRNSTNEMMRDKGLTWFQHNYGSGDFESGHARFDVQVPGFDAVDIGSCGPHYAVYSGGTFRVAQGAVSREIVGWVNDTLSPTGVKRVLIQTRTGWFNVGSVVTVGGQNLTVRETQSVGVHNHFCDGPIPGESAYLLVPSVWETDDYDWPWQPEQTGMAGTTPGSAMDIMGRKAGAADVTAANIILADACLAVERLGAVAVEPFEYVPEEGFGAVATNYPCNPKTWHIRLDGYPRLYLDGDVDPLGELNGTSSGVMYPGKSIPDPLYPRIGLAYESLWDYMTANYPQGGDGDPGVAYAEFGWQGQTNFTVKRARTLVHELGHALIPDAAVAAGAAMDTSYPNLVEMHDIPGVTMPNNDPDPVLGGTIGGSWNFATGANAPDHDSTYNPFVLRYFRRALRAPRLYVWH
ncbi:MAG: hypothetical protein KDC98_04855, partial [Planctomycetes bacterium]|nr:hypothetical protein [Planctomycetota bacterium]